MTQSTNTILFSSGNIVPTQLIFRHHLREALILCFLEFTDGSNNGENKFLDLWMLGFLAQRGLKRLKVWSSCLCEERFVTSIFLTILGHAL